MEKTVKRVAAHPVHPMFPERRSLRAMTGEAMSGTALMRLFEAARWAPSSMNGQPWKFLYAHRGTPEFDRYFDLLMPGNRLWAGNASVLVLLASRAEQDGKPVGMHSFDAGAAWMSLALQGHLDGLVVHAMGGFDKQRAVSALGIPAEWTPEVMIALGHPAEASVLPEKLRERESQPSPRRPGEENVIAGEWK